MKVILVCSVKDRSNFLFPYGLPLSQHRSFYNPSFPLTDLRHHPYCILNFHMQLGLFLNSLLYSISHSVYSCASTTLSVLEAFCCNTLLLPSAFFFFQVFFWGCSCSFVLPNELYNLCV